MGKKRARPINPMVQRVIDRTARDFTPEDVSLSIRISNEYSRGFVTRALSGDPAALNELYTDAKQKRWVRHHQTEAVDSAIRHIALVRTVSGTS